MVLSLRGTKSDSCSIFCEKKEVKKKEEFVV